ncbi:MAG: hypothetical protein JSV49_01625 [Thermoplasmata archaeon]|nr:MAG: hypothetical protein JSV49_01625 [Thermoplasmata archaeon]
MEVLEWLKEPAYVERVVNNLYFIIVTIIALAVLVYAIKTRNKNAIKLFLFSMIVWPAIEGLVWGMGIRFYDSASPQMVFIVVAFMEDPGWVCLAYMVAEKLQERLKKSNTTNTTNTTK